MHGLAWFLIAGHVCSRVPSPDGGEQLAKAERFRARMLQKEEAQRKAAADLSSEREAHAREVKESFSQPFRDVMTRTHPALGPPQLLL